MRLQCDQCILTPLVRTGGNYICDLPWKIDVQASCVRIHQGMVETQHSLPLANISSAFVQTIAELGIPVVVPHLPTIKNLCKEHWVLALGSDYERDPAKTDDNGVINFHNGHDEFNSDGTPDLDKIRSTCVHELMHSWSYGHTGFQWRHGVGQFELDECVADLLGRKVYFRSGTGGVYKTGYGQMSEFIISQFGPAFQKQLKGWTLNRLRDEVRGTRLQQTFDNLDHDHLNGVYRSRFYWEFARWFVTWFLYREDRMVHAMVHGHNAEWFFGTSLYTLFFGQTTGGGLGYGTPRQFYSGTPAEFAGPATAAVAA